MTPERWQQLKHLFGAALERSEQERAAFLAQECATDPSLLAQVETLLASHETASAFLDSAAREDAFRAAGDRLLEPALSRVGPYQILRELGHGGMGTVYLATRADEAYRKEVAIKVIRRGMDTEFVVSRFQNERQILASLVHPNIAVLLDGGTTDDGRPYFVMEYVDGEPIDRYCDARGLSVGERLELFLAVCSAIQYAHRNLIVHRDLKPGNILVTKEGVPELLDFGLAKLLDPKRASPEQTAAHLRFLTPAFASPEQVRGDPITTASDVYALGVLLFVLLTGRRPYGTATSSFEEMARAVCEEEPLKPSALEMSEKLRRRLAGDLDTIILKALRKEPARRYASVEQFAEDLRRHQQGRPVSARPSSTWYRANRFVLRHRFGVAATALIVLSLAGGLFETSRQRARAERRFNDVRKVATSLLFEFHDAIKNRPGVTKARELVVKRAQEYLETLARESASDASLQRDLADAYQRLADVQGRGGLGDTAGAVASLQKAVAIREKLAKERPDDPDSSRALATALDALGLARFSRGDAPGMDDIQRALRLREALAASQPKDPTARLDLARSYGTFGDTLSDRGNYPTALAYRKKASEIVEQVAAEDPKRPGVQREVARAYKNVGALLEMTGSAAAARDLYRKAMSIDAARIVAEPADTEARLDLSFSYGALGFNLLQARELAGALESYRKALALREEIAVADPADAGARAAVARAHRMIGEVLFASGHPAQAVGAALKASKIYEDLSLAAANDRSSRMNVGRISSDLGDDEVAVANDPQTPIAERSAHRRAGCSWYLNSQEIYGELREHAKLTGEDATNYDSNARQLALCDAGLAAAAGARTSPASR